jgi:sigma-B regulation protein RsbU (phosphoserine phosphatase)
MFDLKRRQVTFANSGLPYPVRFSGGRAAQIPMPGVPLGSFPGSTYDEVTIDLQPGDVFVLCSDGIFEAFDEEGREFGAGRVIEVLERSHQLSAREIVSAIFAEMQAFRGEAEQSDDQTVVVVKVSQ